MLVLTPGYAKTVSPQDALVSAVPNGTAPAAAGFFGNDRALLQPGAEDRAAMVYVDANADWKQYAKSKLSPTNYGPIPAQRFQRSDQHDRLYV